MEHCNNSGYWLLICSGLPLNSGALCWPGLKRRSCCWFRPVRWRNPNQYLSYIREVLNWDANLTLLEHNWHSSSVSSEVHT